MNIKCRILPLALICLPLFFTTDSWAQSSKKTFPTPEGYSAERDVVYSRIDGIENKLDIYWMEDASEPLPLIIWIHGGAWRSGDKRSARFARELLGQGYAVASINYRLSGVAKFPAQIIDCKAAVRWLRANAEKYNIDPTRFAAWGGSAGAHLAALLGTAEDMPEWEKGAFLGYSSRVQAVVDWYGPSDFSRMNDTPGKMDHLAPDSPESQLIGAAVKDHPELVAYANPITYVNENNPPFQIFHGKDDLLVLPNQAVLLNEAFQKVGLTPDFALFDDTGHGGQEWNNYIPQAKAFLDKHLKSETSTPNIIYILVDDLGYGDVNFELPGISEFGNPYVQTPHLAKFAKESLVFRHHYAAAPVCSPSRAGLLTGRTPTRHNINLYIRDTKDDDKIFLPGKETTMAEVLKKAEYETAIFGKWHLNGADWEQKENWNGWTGSFPNQQGFDAGMVSKENPHFTRLLKTNTQKHPGDFFTVDGEPLGAIKGYTSDIITEKAVSWMQEERDASKPFFLYLPYDAVHIRVLAADQYENMYNTGNARKDAYYGNITHLDAAIGNLLSALEDMNLSENTLIFFSSDNGPDVLKKWEATYYCYGTSYPLFGQKYQLYEGGIRVPGMVRWPGKIKPGISDDPNSTLDVLPTLCELAGIPLPTERPLDGTSILGHLLDGKPVERENPLYWQFEHPSAFVQTGEGYNRRLDGSQRLPEAPQPVVAIRDGNFVLRGLQTEAFTPPTQFVLYDVVNDPNEKQELSRVKPELFKELKQKLQNKYQEVNNNRKQTTQEIEQKIAQYPE